MAGVQEWVEQGAQEWHFRLGRLNPTGIVLSQLDGDRRRHLDRHTGMR